ncbi:MAG: signal peptidase I [Parcubacteria group bacterium CG10_big_fil_rev_8_21_14_0_10_38_31]|nr:MAG: signal peptidase I [Parcubacteria group bacterium CG10_big_fil_rev_8_21_14_0_10_38_31]
MEKNFEQKDDQIKEGYQTDSDNLLESSSEKKSLWVSVLEFIQFISIALIIIVPLRLWVAQPFIVHGKSMDPTFRNGDYLIVDELSYKFTEPKEGDVIVFRYPNDTKKFFIKRIIGLPNQTIEVEGKTISIEDNEYFVLGDNRGSSSDSRVWGTVNEDLIIGKAFLRLWPVVSIDILPGQDKETSARLLEK